MNYLRLMKLMYLSERQMLLQYGMTITGDSFYALERGSVLSTLLDMIRNKGEDSLKWQELIKTNGYQVALNVDPGDGSLSEAETEIFDEIYDYYNSLSTSDLIDFTHTLPEWEDIYIPESHTSIPITVENILTKSGNAELLPIYQDYYSMAQYMEALKG